MTPKLEFCLTRSPGCVIRVDPGELDVARFEALLDGARTAARDGSWDAAAEDQRQPLAQPRPPGARDAQVSSVDARAAGAELGPRAMGGDMRRACDWPTVCWEARQ